LRALIIEDEIKTAQYLKKGLSEHGFVVDVSHRGEDGLHLALTGDYAFIILDVMLPDTRRLVCYR
jgi:two-component system copper resistance phosphate regulon response regulator CusR